MSGLKMSLDMTAFREVIEATKEAIDHAARPAAQAGAQVLYDAVRQNVQSLGRKTGKLASAIYQAYSPENSKGGRHQYNVSWNSKKAPHAHNVEWGHLQAYATYRGSDGQYRPIVRPDMRGKPRPKSAAAKAAYYVPRKGGPVHVPGKAFVRRAVDQFPKAQQAMQDEFFKRLKAAKVIK